MNTRHTIAALILAATCTAAAPSARAMFMPLKDEPVSRLVTNLKAKTKESPNDAAAWYALGRVHSMAFTRAADRVPVYDSKTVIPDDGVPGSGPRNSWDKPEKPPAPMTDEQKRAHLRDGLSAMEHAINLKPEPPEQHISYAFLLEKGEALALDIDYMPGAKNADIAAKKKAIEKAVKDLESKDAPAAEKLITDSGPSGLLTALRASRTSPAPLKATIDRLVKAHWQSQIREHYLQAFKKSLEPDLKREFLMGGLNVLISHEAGTAYLRLADELPKEAQNQKDIDTVKEGIAKLKEHKYGEVITPIIFSLDGSHALSDLIDPTSRVPFDLDGTGRQQQWGWVKPDTGLLVWDPTHTGKITSGRQLFGSVSWWIFFENGYQALDALDDNRDGELTSSELTGISVWFDRNSNGISDPGEVIPTDQLGITGISCRVTSKDGPSPTNPQGLRMANGQTLPTYDWIATPTTPKPTSPIAATIIAGTTLTGFAAFKRRGTQRGQR